MSTPNASGWSTRFSAMSTILVQDRLMGDKRDVTQYWYNTRTGQVEEGSRRSSWTPRTTAVTPGRQRTSAGSVAERYFLTPGTPGSALQELPPPDRPGRRR